MEPDKPKPDEATQASGGLTQESSPHDLDTRPATEAPLSGSHPARTPSFRLSQGQTFGPYEIKRPLGRGGMGEVYEALHKESGHRLALKLLSTELSWSESQRQRFLREGTLAASINHPNSLYVYGTDEIDGIPVIAMELARGGTIKQRVEESGGLSPAEPVDAVIQIASGLQAAESAGILHRDIKPGNCFVDRDGSVKIGDFGLAISTTGPDTANLTATGSFLGTPAFASPEQVRGGDLDARSDIYSVGATLYYLLTGQSPFEGLLGMQMMAAVLEKKPKPPVSKKHAIPTGLQKVVLRCLEKDPSARPKTYDELKTVLAPFGSRAPRLVPFTTRFVAGFVDYLILMLISSPLVLMFEGEPKTSIPVAILGMVLSWIYGGLFEGLWGATPGKRLMRIRVLSLRGNIPGIPRALLRSVLFWLGFAIINTIALSLFHLPLGESVNSFGDTMIFFCWLGIVAVFVTARPANGWSGIHDRFSATRVVLEQSAVTRAYQAEPAKETVADAQGRIGPYRIPTALQDAAPGKVILGLDPTLQRKVWIRKEQTDAPSLSDARRDVSRPGRLRWLNGRRATNDAWDAFEAVDGQPLIDVAKNRQQWSTVRHWLHDLAEEARHLTPDELSSELLSLDRVWITSSGRALLLDFPVPLASQEEEHTKDQLPKEETRLGTFLQKVATSALSGFSGDDKPTLGTLPLHAQKLLTRLVDEPDRPAEEIATELSDNLVRKTSISSRRRACQLVLVAFLGLGFAFFSVVGTIAAWIFIEKNNPDIELFDESFDRLEEIEEADGPYDPEVEAERRSLEILLAGPLRHVATTDSVVILGQKFKATNWTSAQGDRLDQLLEDNPNPSEEEIASARKTLEKFIADQKDSRKPWSLALQVVVAGAMILFGSLVVLLPVYLLFGFAFRGGMSHKLLGMALVRGDGLEASRLRCLYRSLIGWAPLIFCVSFFFYRLSDPAPAREGGKFIHWIGFFFNSVTDGVPQIIAIVIFFIGVIWTIARPTRGLHDRIAGTHVVPM